MAEYLKSNLAAVRERAAAAERAGRDPAEIEIVAVGKTHPAEVLRAAIDAGAMALGENRVQEAEPKILEIGRAAVFWHLIGHLQSNKARKAVQLFDVIQSLDSIELAQRLERICVEENKFSLRVYVQVDLAGEMTKSGIAESGLEPLTEFLTTCNRLKFEGLMTVPPFFSDAEAVRPYFRKLREIRDRLSAQNLFAGEIGGLSMGMSHDFETAIEEGATVIRVGTAIFGERG